MTAHILIELIKAYADGDDDVSVRTDYSGRSMYGRTCVGAVMSDMQDAVGLVGWIVAQADAAEQENVAEALSNCRFDSMGRRTIIYWPSIKLAEEGTA